MFGEFWRHGSNAALACGVLIICACAALGFAPLSPLWILAGVLVFHSSEYTFHTFPFPCAAVQTRVAAKPSAPPAL
jgi:hypothetical protein